MNDPNTDFATNAAKERERLYALEATGHFWRGIRLQPWTARRDLLFIALQDAMLEDPLYEGMNNLDHLTVIDEKIKQLLSQQKTITPDVETSDLINWTRFQPGAACVLYLAHHKPEDWATISADIRAWLNVIMTWADAHIEPDELAAAVRLSHTLRTAHHQLVTLPRPDATTKRRDSGN